MCIVKLQLYAKGLASSQVGKHFSKTFSFTYMLNIKKFSFYNFNWYVSNEKSNFADRSRARPSIFFMEKVSGRKVGMSKLWCNDFPEDWFDLKKKSVNPDEM